MLDFDWGFMDDLSFGGTKLLRDQILQHSGEVINEPSHTAGELSSLVAVIVPIPGLQEAQGAKLLIGFEQFLQRADAFAKTTSNAALVWKLGATVRGYRTRCYDTRICTERISMGRNCQ